MTAPLGGLLRGMAGLRGVAETPTSVTGAGVGLREPSPQSLNPSQTEASLGGADTTKAHCAGSQATSCIVTSLASTQNKLRRGPTCFQGLIFPLGQPGRKKEGPESPFKLGFSQAEQAPSSLTLSCAQRQLPACPFLASLPYEPEIFPLAFGSSNLHTNTWGRYG